MNSHPPSSVNNTRGSTCRIFTDYVVFKCLLRRTRVYRGIKSNIYRICLAPVTSTWECILYSEVFKLWVETQVWAASTFPLGCGPFHDSYQKKKKKKTEQNKNNGCNGKVETKWIQKITFFFQKEFHYIIVRFHSICNLLKFRSVATEKLKW